MKQLLNRARAWAKDLAIDQPLVRSAYARALHTSGRLNSAVGRHLVGTEQFLRGLRAVSYSSAPPSFRNELHERVSRYCRTDGKLARIEDNVLLRRFLDSTGPEPIRERYATFPVPYRVRMKRPDPGSTPSTPGNLILLKPFDPRTGEKGVILIKYTEAIRTFVSIFDLPRLFQSYMLVVEPSWWGYEDVTFLTLVGRDAAVLVQAPFEPDFEFMQGLRTNLVPVRLGAGDWVDPDVCSPDSADSPTYDVAMVSSWHPLKRHEELLAAVPSLQRRLGRPVRLVLIGYPDVWTRENIEVLVDEYGLTENTTILEQIPFREVSNAVASSSVYVLLSRREGANKALYESLFSDTPVVVPVCHRGVNHEHVNTKTGMFFQEGRLDEALEEILRDPERFTPREWAQRHTGMHNSTSRLNSALKAEAERRGEAWTSDIVAKKNAPGLEYENDRIHRDMDPAYEHLAGLLVVS